MQPTQRVPRRLFAVGEAEIAKDTLEVVLIIIRDIPKYGLEVARSRRLIDGIDHLFEAIRNDFVHRALLLGKVYDLVGAQIEVIAVFLLEEIAHIHQKLRRGASARQHGGDDKHHIYKAAAETFQVSRRRRVAAYVHRAVEEPRIHRDTRTIISQAGFVVFIDKVVVEQIQIAFGQSLAIHLLDAVCQEATVEADEAPFGQFADQRRDIFVFDVSVGVIL